MTGLEHADLVERLASRTVELIEREYPNVIRLTLSGPPTSVITPRTIYPAFYGCYDWHSAVHSHWQIVRALRGVPEASFEVAATAALDRTLTPANIAIEMEWMTGRPSFEMPYGMAWLLSLCRELRDWSDDRALRWEGALRSMEAHAIRQFERYCSTLTVPMRGGLHNQTAFSLSLAWDATPTLRGPILEAATRFFGEDTEIDLRHEPSAADFLSPALCEADLMSRVLAGDELTTWVERFAPHGFERLQPVDVVDPSNGQLAHWAGLNLSRSWMMASLADSLPAAHPLVDGLRTGAATHRAKGLATADHDDYMISHWVPTFAVYLLTSVDTDR